MILKVEALDQFHIRGRGKVLIVDSRSYDLTFLNGGVFYTELDNAREFWEIRGIERMGSRPVIGLPVRERQ